MCARSRRSGTAAGSPERWVTTAARVRRSAVDTMRARSVLERDTAAVVDVAAVLDMAARQPPSCPAREALPGSTEDRARVEWGCQDGPVTEAPIDRTLADLAERISFLFPHFASGSDGAGDLDTLDGVRVLDELDHEPTRLALVEQEHEQELAQAAQIGAANVHVSMHLVVANQVLAHNPPEVWPTLQRIVTKGYTRHDALHMVAAGMADVIRSAMSGQPAPPEVYLRYLAGLPDQSVRNRPAPTSRTGGTAKASKRKRR